MSANALLVATLLLLLPLRASALDIPRTGQTTSYADNDDGDLETGLAWPSPRFTANGDGTITDNLTGLMWLADLNCLATIGLDDDGDVPWADTFALADAVNGGADCAGYTAAHTDWRMPNVNEWESLYNYDQDGIAWLADHGFVNVPVAPEYHWSSSSRGSACTSFFTSASGSTSGTSIYRAAVVRADATGPARLPKTGVTTSCHVSDDGDLERGAPWPTPRFADNGDGTVTDRLTNLMWMKDTACIRSSGRDADGAITWAAALGFAETVNGGANLSACAGYNAGHTDWRLPNVREVRSLTDFSRLTPSLPADHPFVNVESSFTSLAYWTSTTWEIDPSQAFVLRFGAPLTTSQAKTDTQAVWLVRDAPAGSEGCVASDTTLCLNDGLFAVTTTWRTVQGAQGVGHAVSLTADTGYFWFFNPANVEMVVKVLNGCPVNQRFWVFAGGLTNVEVSMAVTDTQNDAVKTYQNPISTAFLPIQDTGAFATCP